MDETVYLLASFWEDVRALSGWAGLLAVGLMLAVTEYMRRTFASEKDLKAERENRETADGHQDDRIHYLSELVHQYMGKIDILRDRLEAADRAREREVAELRSDVREGFARLEESLKRYTEQHGGGEQ